MQSLTLARPYARAAFGLARDGGGYAGWSQALAFAAAAASDPRVAQLLGHPRLSQADAVSLLSPPASGQDAAEAGFGRFLAMLAGNRRLALLPEIAGLYEELRADAERVVKAKVTSAAILPDAQLASIREALRKRFGREVEVETDLDPSLIGGAVIDAGDIVIDGSIKGKLGRLQAALGQ